MRVAKLCCLLLLLSLVVIVAKIKADMEVKRKAVLAILLLEGLNNEEKKTKRSCKVRQ